MAWGEKGALSQKFLDAVRQILPSVTELQHSLPDTLGLGLRRNPHWPCRRIRMRPRLAVAYPIAMRTGHSDWTGAPQSPVGAYVENMFRAQGFLTAATSLAEAERLSLRDSAIVIKDDSGKTVVNETIDPPPRAAGVLELGFGLVLRREIAALSMSGSSIIVAVNAVMLKRLKLPHRNLPPSPRLPYQNARQATLTKAMSQ